MKTITLQLPDETLKRIKRYKKPGRDIKTSILALLETGINKRNTDIAIERH